MAATSVFFPVCCKSASSWRSGYVVTLGSCFHMSSQVHSSCIFICCRFLDKMCRLNTVLSQLPTCFLLELDFVKQSLAVSRYIMYAFFESVCLNEEPSLLMVQKMFSIAKIRNILLGCEVNIYRSIGVTLRELILSLVL